jgi:hypothetical protein
MKVQPEALHGLTCTVFLDLQQLCFQVKHEKPILLVGGLESGLLADAFRTRWKTENGTEVREIDPGTQMTKSEFIYSMLKGFDVSIL